MQVSSAKPQMSGIENNSSIKNVYTEKLTKGEVADIRNQLVENSNAFAFQSTSLQTNISSSDSDFTNAYDDFQSFLYDVGYQGKPIAELSQDEAAELVSEDGFFGIEQTSQRIASFVIDNAGGDEDRLRAGREGMMQGFKEAEEMWGGELPEIAQKTMQAAIEMVDKAMYDLGYSIINQEV